LRERTNDRERFFITASYDLVVTGDIERARQTCILDIRAYPRDANIHGFLAGMVYPLLGQYDKAIQESKKVVELNPEIGFGYNLFAANNLSVDRPEEAEEVLNRAAAHQLDIPDFLLVRYQIAFLRGDQAAMDRVGEQARGRAGGEDMITGMKAFSLAYSGHLQGARDISRQAVELARQASQKERAAAFETGAALREAFFGNADEARRNAHAALELSRGRDAQYGAALSLALAGDSVGSEKLTEDLEKRFPEDTVTRFNYVPTLRAQLALNHRQPARAVEWLQGNVPYELGVPPSTFLGLYGPLYPVYMRGIAYLAEGRGAEAALEFQKILAHRGIVVADPIGALAHLQLGRAYAIAGDAAKAKAAYSDFLTQWKEADPGIPILQQARTEYAKL
jgi:tetratricopeptide (TPR) repeat protein